MKTVLLRSKNVSATEFYYDIVKKSLEQCSELIYDGFETRELPKDRDVIIVVGSCIAFAKARAMGYRKIVTWFQGVLPEESYMRNQSKTRRKVLEMVEKYALKKSIVSIFVSEALKEHYEKKYGIKIENYYIMPCFNAVFNENGFAKIETRKRVFTYTGGLSKWQCIDQTLKLYKRVEDLVPEKVELLLLTPEQEKAAALVKRYGIRNVEITCVHYTKLPEKLQNVSFGFTLREDNAVNRVATPTKLANYVANGIMPIYSKCILDFANISVDNPYQVVIEDVNKIRDDEIEKIVALLDKEISMEALKEQSKSYFKQYYNPDWHIRQLAEKLGRLG